MKIEEVLVPHVEWFLHEAGDDVARYLDEGWYEYREQAFMWLYAREDDVFIDCGAHFGLYRSFTERPRGELPSTATARERWRDGRITATHN